MYPATRAPQFRPTLTLLGLLVLHATLLLSGCGTTGQGPFRTGADDSRRVIETFPNAAQPAYGHEFKLGYVELDDQGWLWSQRDSDRMAGSQLQEVERMVIQEANLQDGKKSAEGIILIAFIHGWRNNAALDNENVASFKRLLDQISAEQAGLGDLKRKVVGVYIGWPGQTLPEPLSIATFYSRKNAADRVGYYSGVTQVLCTLEALHRKINGALADGKPRSCFVTAGHSFGAQVAYNAVTTILMQRLTDVCVDEAVHNETDHPERLAEGAPRIARAKSAGRVVKPFGDLLLLINPAFEAERYENLWRLSREFDYPNNRQRTVFAIFSSDGDWATQLAFPVGRYTSTAFERYRDDNLGDEQRAANHHTISWTPRYVTHTLRKDSDPETDEEAKEETLEEDLVKRGEVGNLRAKNVDSNSNEWLATVIHDWNSQTRVGTLDLAHCVLRPVKPDAHDWTPFYVVRVRKSLVKDHSAIWGDDFREFLVKFLTAENPPRRD